MRQHLINKAIGQWDDVLYFKLALDLVDCTDDKQRIKIFIIYIKKHSELMSELLSVAIYICPKLEESFTKLIILI